MRLSAYLILGCNGSGDHDFVYCNKVESVVLDLDLFEHEKYVLLVKFFDEACGLFMNHINNHNKCVNVLSLLYKQYGAYNEQMLHRIQKFIKMHKDCGIWLSLIMKEDFYKNE